MKKIFYLFLVPVIAFCLISCRKDKEAFRYDTIISIKGKTSSTEDSCLQFINKNSKKEYEDINSFFSQFSEITYSYSSLGKSTTTVSEGVFGSKVKELDYFDFTLKINDEEKNLYYKVRKNILNSVIGFDFSSHENFDNTNNFSVYQEEKLSVILFGSDKKKQILYEIQDASKENLNYFRVLVSYS